MKLVLSSLLLSVLILAGCSNPLSKEDVLPTVPRVDLDRYMGQWYVVAAVPSLVDSKAYNAIQDYSWNDDGSIGIEYSFLKDGFAGDLKNYEMSGRVFNAATNAEWRLHFFWPFRAEYLVIYLEPDYSLAIVGHSSRDYAWVLSRTPNISDRKYSDLVLFLQNRGYNISDLRKVPQNW